MLKPTDSLEVVWLPLAPSPAAWQMAKFKHGRNWVKPCTNLTRSVFPFPLYVTVVGSHSPGRKQAKKYTSRVTLHFSKLFSAVSSLLMWLTAQSVMNISLTCLAID